MIEVREDIAWVRAADGRQTPFDPCRLAHSIQRACEFTGQTDALMSESIAAAVAFSAAGKTIAATELARTVLVVLTTLACDDVARAYAHRHEHAEIRLDQMAGFELDFYRQLDAALRTASASEAMAAVQLRGLRACVMRLRGAQRWSDSCRTLAEEILNFVRARASQARPDRAGALNLEVRE